MPYVPRDAFRFCATADFHPPDPMRSGHPVAARAAGRTARAVSLAVLSGMTLATAASAMPSPQSDATGPTSLTAPPASAPTAAPASGPASGPAAASSGAQASTPAAPGAPTTRKLVEDFLHYVRIARPDLAAASAKALFDSGASDAEIADIIDDNDLGPRVETVMQYGRGMEGVSELVGEFESRLEKGRRDLSRDPERIRQAVKMLTGSRREQILAQGRLAAAGEYAVPELLRQVVETKDPQLELAAADMLVAMKRQAVTPLSAALPNLDAANQRQVAEILGIIGWPHAAPALLALAENPATSPEVRSAATQAFGAVGGTNPDLSAQWTQLAKRYFDGEQSLIAFPGDVTNNVWGWDNFVGLVPTPVPTPIFTEVMAMKSAQSALRARADNADALSLWVASDLRRENELPPGDTDPIFGASPFSPQFFATAAGTSAASRVLALGLASFDTALSRDAILALRQTAGAGNLGFDPAASDAAAGSSAVQPLVDAMQFPDRRVQYESAIALGSGLPTRTFSGDFAVVPTLASAVRSVGASYAAVVTPDNEDRDTITNRLKAMGFTVLNPGPSILSIDADIAAAPGVDVVVVRGPEQWVKGEIATARSNRKLIAAPIVAVTSGVDKVKLDREFISDPRVMVWQGGGTDEQFSAAVDQVMNRASGGRITEAESQQYAIEALGALGAIAQANNLSGSPVYRVQDAQSALFEALDKRTGGIRLLVADVLSQTPTDEAQRRLLDAALAATEAEQVELLDRVAASARRFGNRVEPRQIDALLQLVGASSGANADAAARVHGALNLPPANAVKLIVK